MVEQNLLAVRYVPTDDQLVDVFTKPLPSPRFAGLGGKVPVISPDRFHGVMKWTKGLLFFGLLGCLAYWFGFCLLVYLPHWFAGLLLPFA